MHVCFPTESLEPPRSRSRVNREFLFHDPSAPLCKHIVIRRGELLFFFFFRVRLSFFFGLADPLFSFESAFKAKRWVPSRLATTLMHHPLHLAFACRSRTFPILYLPLPSNRLGVLYLVGVFSRRRRVFRLFHLPDFLASLHFCPLLPASRFFFASGLKRGLVRCALNSILAPQTTSPSLFHFFLAGLGQASRNPGPSLAPRNSSGEAFSS